jgi:hypothetical protein
MELFPRNEKKPIFCPRCASRAQLFLYKPACANCGWNVQAAKTNVLRQLRNSLIPFALFTLVLNLDAIAKTDRSFSLLVVLWPALFGGLWFGYEYFRLARISEAKIVAPLEPPTAIFPQMPRLESSYNFKFLLLLFSELAFVAITGWFAYSNLGRILEALRTRRFDPDLTVLIFHLLGLFHLVSTAPGKLRAFFAEGKIANFGQAAVGTVVSETYGAQMGNQIEYEFRDVSGGMQRGKGMDFSGQLYEDMRIMVLFNPSDSRESVPICGLVAHKVVT